MSGYGYHGHGAESGLLLHGLVDGADDGAGVGECAKLLALQSYALKQSLVEVARGGVEHL